MSDVFKKMNLTNQKSIAVFNAPESFEHELALLRGVDVVRNPKSSKSLKFAVAFATTQAELDRCAAKLAASADGDAILWFAYPKASSKRYRCEFNRDTGWHVIRKAGFDSVRQVAIDADWSALRFRRVAFIKSTAAK
jgi:hypothetical protein